LPYGSALPAGGCTGLPLAVHLPCRPLGHRGGRQRVGAQPGLFNRSRLPLLTTGVAMANDFDGDVYDFPNMTDDEIRDVVLEHLRNYSSINADEIDVVVRNGAVTLTGRVGTDTEVEV